MVDGRASKDPGAAGRPQALPQRVAEMVVFLATAAVLVLEIVALRLVAPYVGLTLETSSAVIGTALAAIAVGAWTGGRWADGTDPARWLGPILLLSGLLTMLTLPVVRYVGAATQGSGEVSVVLLMAMVAVFPPAALLSAITPTVVKLQLADLGLTGTVVGRFSGIATLGAIMATFLTGFVLLAAFPSSVILLGTGAVLIVVGGVLSWYRGARVRPGWVRGLAVLFVVPVVVVTAPDPCQVETAYHCALVAGAAERPSGRVLQLDNLRHSYVDLADPRYLEFEYIQVVAAAADAVREPRAPVSALLIGGGGFTLPRYLASTRPGSSSTVLEIDPGVVDLGRRELGVDQIPGLTVRIGDARTHLAAQPSGRFDLLVGDAFGGVAVPWHLTTRETALQLRRLLRDDGIYAVNVIDYQPDAFARAELATLRSVFDHVAIAAASSTLEGTGGGNHVLLASTSRLPLDSVAEQMDQTTPGWTLLDPAATARFAGDATVLTDDHAPVDQLITPRPRQRSRARSVDRRVSRSARAAAVPHDRRTTVRRRAGSAQMFGFIVAGLIIGALARLIKPGKQNLGLLATLLLGLAGSVIGGVVANLLGTGGIFELNVLGFVVAVVAAVLLVGTAEAMSGSRRRAVR